MGRENHHRSHADGKKPVWTQTAFEFPDADPIGSGNATTTFCGSCLDTGWIWQRCPNGRGSERIYCGDPTCKKNRSHRYPAPCPCCAENPVIQKRRGAASCPR